MGNSGVGLALLVPFLLPPEPLLDGALLLLAVFLPAPIFLPLGAAGSSAGARFDAGGGTPPGRGKITFKIWGGFATVTVLLTNRLPSQVL